MISCHTLRKFWLLQQHKLEGQGLHFRNIEIFNFRALPAVYVVLLALFALSSIKKTLQFFISRIQLDVIAIVCELGAEFGPRGCRRDVVHF